MKFAKVPVGRRGVAVNHALERIMDRYVRGRDALRGRLGLGGRKAAYDDEAYEFVGGPRDRLRAQHYDKSLRLLWKAEGEAPWSSFRDQTSLERALAGQAEQGLTPAEREARARLTLPEFRALLDREYSPREKQALVAILSAIGHGEAYAWLVSAELLGQVKSTGAKAALTLQVLEEAKHFVVLRELVLAFGVPVPRLCAWEYELLEGVLAARGPDQLFGMNVLVEGIALSIFGMLGHLPGLEVLRLFHQDESRHTALPHNYLREFPLTAWERRSPLARLRRLRLLLPAIPLVFFLEDELAELGIDAFEFGGAVIRKLAHLTDRAGFLLPLPTEVVVDGLNAAFNAYCRLTRPGFTRRDFRAAETTRDAAILAVEHEALGV